MPQEKPEVSWTNPYASPGDCSSDEILAQFPKTRLLLAGICPLKDEGILLLNRLLKNGVDAKAVEARMMPHGFLNLAIKLQGMAEAYPCVIKAVDLLLELI